MTGLSWEREVAITLSSQIRRARDQKFTYTPVRTAPLKLNWAGVGTTTVESGLARLQILGDTGA